MLRKVRDLFVAYNKCAIEDALRRSQWGLGWPGHLPRVSIFYVKESIWYGTACASKRVISRKLPGRWRDRFRTGFVSSTFWAKPLEL